MAELNMDEVRERIEELDRIIIASSAERVRLARGLAHEKARRGLPTVDFGQELRVLERARDLADEHGLAEEAVEDVMGRLIEEAVTAQEDERIRLTAGGEGRRAVIIGGAGRMGGWITSFLAAQGHHVEVVDPAVDPGADILAEHVMQADLVIVAVPPTTVAEVYHAWKGRAPRGVICDVASIKAPFLEQMHVLAREGARMASIHPMFGPSARVLRGVDVVVCDTGDTEATKVAEEMFSSTAARIVHVPFDDHDRWMADVLALAHATALAFATALPETPRPVRSTTLAALLEVARGVVTESPDVYYEIQADNPYARESLRRLADAIYAIEATVGVEDRTGFADLMDLGRRRVQAQETP